MRLNVTYAGLSEFVAEVDSFTSDEDIKRIAEEVVKTSEVWSTENIPNDPFHNYVVDRFVQSDTVYLRPKVPFG